MPAPTEVVTGSTTSDTSFTLTSWTPAANDLILVGVGVRDESKTVTVSGNGLTFVEVADVDNVQGQCGVTLFRAQGASPTTGQITVSISGNSLPVGAIAARWSDMATGGTHGSEAVEAYSTNAGPDPDDDDMLESVTTVTDGATAVAFGTHRTKTFTVPGGETAVSINLAAGSGGNLTTSSMWRQDVPSAGSTQLGDTADLSGDTDWCMIVVSLKPAGGGTQSGSLSMGRDAGATLAGAMTTGQATSLARSAAASFAAGLLASEAMTLARSAGASLASATIRGGQLALDRTAAVAHVAAAAASGAMSLARSHGVSLVGVRQAVQGTVTLARSVAASMAGAASTAGSVTMARLGSVAQAAAATASGTLSLARSHGITLAGVKLAVQGALTLARDAGVSVSATASAAAAVALGRVSTMLAQAGDFIVACLGLLHAPATTLGLADSKATGMDIGSAAVTAMSLQDASVAVLEVGHAQVTEVDLVDECRE